MLKNLIELFDNIKNKNFYIIFKIFEDNLYNIFNLLLIYIKYKDNKI